LTSTPGRPMTARDWTARLHAPTLAVVAPIIAVWSFSSWRYGAYVLPPPLAVVAGFREVLVSGEIWTHTGASLARIAVGFGGALVVALVMGLVAFLSRTARAIVHDFLAVLNSTSVFVWIVLSIIWFGLSNWAPIFTTFMITLPVVASNIVEGVASVDRRLLEMGEVYRLSGWQKFRAIVVPSTLPYLVAGMKVGFGLALKVSVVAEIFGVTSGIGYIMNYSREILATQMVFVWALVMILVMTATDKLVFDTLSRRLARWR
jgi:NitT/TauT family transport system permease protein